jgi:hypothetical protein
LRVVATIEHLSLRDAFLAGYAKAVQEFAPTRFNKAVHDIAVDRIVSRQHRDITLGPPVITIDHIPIDHEAVRFREMIPQRDFTEMICGPPTKIWMKGQAGPWLDNQAKAIIQAKGHDGSMLLSLLCPLLYEVEGVKPILTVLTDKYGRGAAKRYFRDASSRGIVELVEIKKGKETVRVIKAPSPTSHSSCS